MYLILDKNFQLDHIQCVTSALKESDNLDKKSLVHQIKKQEYDVFFINIRSLGKHFQDLENDFYAKQSRYVCLAETWVEPEAEINYEVENKSFKFASIGRGKGVCIIGGGNTGETKTFCTEYFQHPSVEKLRAPAELEPS